MTNNSCIVTAENTPNKKFTCEKINNYFFEFQYSISTDYGKAVLDNMYLRTY